MDRTIGKHGIMSPSNVEQHRSLCKNLPLLAFKSIIVAGTAFGLIRCWEIQKMGGVLLFGIWMCCSVGSLVFTTGWTIPALMFGIFAGELLTSPIGNGRSIWESARHEINICLGAVIGLSSGVAIDAWSRSKVTATTGASDE
ncbi:MAG: hypothetical protein JWN70_6053 [Planctomycetaceae bacterium]|nr:hypothetical protein [Planctomycetaceae bacterium]